MVAVGAVVGTGLSLTQPAAAGRTVTTIVYDSFNGADYDLEDYLSKWNNGFGPGEMAIEDTRAFNGSSFSVSALPFQTAADFSVFDHIKYLALSNESFAVPDEGSVTFCRFHRRHHRRDRPGRPCDPRDLRPAGLCRRPHVRGRQALRGKVSPSRANKLGRPST